MSLYFIKLRFVKSRFIKSIFINQDSLNQDSLNQDLSVPPNNSRRCKSSHDTFIHEKSYYMHAILWHMSAFHFSGDFFCNPKNILTTHTPPLFILKYVTSPPPSNKKLNLDRPEVNSSPKFLNPRKIQNPTHRVENL